jgi:hypothetical protein
MYKTLKIATFISFLILVILILYKPSLTEYPTIIPGYNEHITVTSEEPNIPLLNKCDIKSKYYFKMKILDENGSVLYQTDKPIAPQESVDWCAYSSFVENGEYHVIMEIEVIYKPFGNFDFFNKKVNGVILDFFVNVK